MSDFSNTYTIFEHFLNYFCLGLVVGLVFGVVLEIFEILLPRITSGLKIFFTFHFFTFFSTVGLVLGGVFKILLYRVGRDRFFFIALSFE